jgi:tetratricopeptide (TPR) repeat protein
LWRREKKVLKRRSFFGNVHMIQFTGRFGVMNAPIIFVATAWGPRHGGINAFNADICRALGKKLQQIRQVICIVAGKRDEAAEADALKSHVRLLATEKETLDSGGITLALRKAGIEEVAWWIGHDVTTGPATLEARELKGGGNVALIHHMSFRQYAGHKHQAGEVAVRREEEQRALFRQADRCFAVGPKLRDSLHELLDVAEKPPMLIPGLAQEIQPKPPAKTFRAMVFGRLDSDDDRIKQGRLAVAGVAAAVGQAAATPGSPPLLTGSRGIIDVIGIKDAGGETEKSLIKLAEDLGGSYPPQVTAQPFQEDRRQMFTQLAGAHLALMPSWHEGFGLVGWEAVAAGVPLILSVDSGLYQLLREETPGLQNGNVYGVKVGGHTPTGDDDPNQENFTDADLDALKNAVLNIAANAGEWRDQAAFLRRTLLDKGMTWDGAAKALLSGLGLNDPPPADVAPPPNPSDPTPGDGLPADRRRPLPAGYFPNSLLLRAEYQVTPFQDFAAPALNNLLAWVTDEQASPYAAALRLYAADGGSGKTRLLIEACGRLRDRGAGDWTTRFIPDGLSPDKLGQAVEKLVKAHAKVFLAMDYAETRQKAVLAVTAAMLAAPAGHRVRLVLTARGQGEWWEVLPANVKDERLRGFLRSEDVAQGPLALPVPADDAATRLGIYQSAQAAFARLPLFQGKTPTPAPDLSGPLFARTLFIHLAALSALQGRRLENEKELLAAALDHERDYWRRTLGESARGESAGDETALRRIEQAMALLTLADGTADPVAARAVIAAAPLLRDQTATAQEALFNNLHTIYPRNGGVDALRPDLLGETLIHAALTNDERLLDTALDGENASVGAALTALTRLADRGKPQWLERALDQKRLKQGFVDQVMETALQLGPTLGDALAAAVDGAEQRIRNGLVNHLFAKLPEQTVALAVLSEKISRRKVELLENGNHNGQGKKFDLLRAQEKLGIVLRKNGGPAEGLVVAKRNMELAKTLSDTPPNFARSQGLAVAYNLLSICLRDLGDTKGALGMAAESGKIYNDLRCKEPAAFLSVWALSLDTLAMHLGDMGRHEEALGKARQSEEIRRQPVVARLDAHRADWALSLNNLAKHLSDMGLYEEALEKSRRAEEIYRQLAVVRPDAHRADWATSLSGLTSHLSAMGLHEEALDKARRSEEIYRQLAVARPDAHRAAWATSLGNWAQALLALDRGAEAEAEARQAMEIFAALPPSRIKAMAPELGWSRVLTAAARLNQGDGAGAADLAEQALEAYRIAEQARPGDVARYHALALSIIARRPGLDPAVAAARAGEALDLIAPHARRRKQGLRWELSHVAAALRATAAPGAPDPLPGDLAAILAQAPSPAAA